MPDRRPRWGMQTSKSSTKQASAAAAGVARRSLTASADPRLELRPWVCGDFAAARLGDRPTLRPSKSRLPQLNDDLPKLALRLGCQSILQNRSSNRLCGWTASLAQPGMPMDRSRTGAERTQMIHDRSGRRLRHCAQHQWSNSRRKRAPCLANSSCDEASGRQIDAAFAISTVPGVKDSITAAPSYSTSRSASRIPIQSW